MNARLVMFRLTALLLLVSLSSAPLGPAFAAPPVQPAGQLGEPGVTLTPTGGDTVVAEGGAADQYSIVLNSAPASDVTITIAPNGQVSVDKTSLTFTSGNWNIAQDVTVSAVDDAVDEANPHAGSIGHSAASADGVYNTPPLTIDNITVSITDNDQAGVTVVQSDGSTAVTEGGAGDSYTVALTSQPTDIVTVNFAVDGQIQAISPLTFTNANWNTPKTVSVLAVDDDVDEVTPHSSSINLTTASDDPLNSGLTAQVAVSITDDDTAGVTITESGGTAVTEGGAGDSYTVVLNSQPANTVTINFNVGAQIQAIPNIQFTSANWSTPQQVNVSALNDMVTEANPHPATIIHTASSGDPNYQNPPLIIPDVIVSIADNDAAEVIITQTGGTTAVGEGDPGGDTYTLVLNSQPSADVTISFSVDAQIQAISPLTFISADWNTPKTVTVKAVDDKVVEASPHPGTINHTAASTDPNYQSPTVPIEALVVQITDDDVAGVKILPSGSIDVTEGSPVGDTYTIELNSQPVADVTLSFAVGTEIQPIGSLTFTSATWNVPQTVTVLAVDDNKVEGSPHTGTISHTATSVDPNYQSPTVPIQNVDVNINITDNDAAGVSIGQSGGGTAVTEGDSAGDTLTVALSNQPVNDVTISFSVSAQLQPTAPTSFTFSSANWNVPQTVTVRAVDDKVDEALTHSGTISFSITSNAPGYKTLTVQPVTVQITDDDTAGVTIVETDTSTAVIEGDPAGDTYTVVLTSQPSADVTISFGVDAQIQAISSLTFTSANWNTPKTVSVLADDDKLDEASPHPGTVSHAATSSDLLYNGLTVASVAVSITDNDTTPEALPDTSYVLRLGETLQVPAGSGVLANDSDQDGGPGLTAHLVTPPQFATGANFKLDSTGAFTYTPETAVPIVDSFYYYASDGYNNSKTVRVEIAVIDQDSPTVTWLNPVSTGQVFMGALNRTLLLQVDAIDNVKVDRVRFYRWDALWPPYGKYTDIVELDQGPWQFQLDTSTLNLGWNEIFVRAYDSGGRESPRASIFVFIKGSRIYLPQVSKTP